MKKICPVCGKEFEAKRKDTIFCNPKCKDKKKREKNPEKVKERNKKWREKNPEKAKERNKKWREKNPEKAKEGYKKWREKNPEKAKEQDKKRREKNSEKFKEQNKKWREKNPEKVKERNYKKMYLHDYPELFKGLTLEEIKKRIKEIKYYKKEYKNFRTDENQITPTPQLDLVSSEKFLNKIERDLKNPVGNVPTPKLKKANDAKINKEDDLL